MWFTKSYSAAARWGEECVSVCARVCALSLRLLKRLDILILFLRDRLEQGDKWTTVEELSHRGPYHVSPLKVEIKVLHLSVHVIYSPISHLFCLFLCIWCCIWFSLFYLLPLARSLLRWPVCYAVWQQRHYRDRQPVTPFTPGIKGIVHPDVPGPLSKNNKYLYKVKGVVHPKCFH